MTVTAAEVASKTMPAKAVGQQQEESCSLKLLNTAKHDLGTLASKQLTGDFRNNNRMVNGILRHELSAILQAAVC